ncbi:trypsin-like serine peptidase [Thermoflavimicrobium daqui]|uniref:Serine protease n=1 Tax=Thermoflavimicrobium daqui TaxID=2137476 RepID=A0A364K0Q1_9BACL|nr:trypsin-like peptidase domain-containing protein [Thermoflavimicrobium daqui]RAL21081.1 hypothetical protein DL897_17095 [Thermoflavimicrobium daqui]
MGKFSKIILSIGLSVAITGMTLPSVSAQTSQPKSEKLQVAKMQKKKVSELPKEQQEKIKKMKELAKEKGIYSHNNLSKKSKGGSIHHLDMEKVKKLPDHASIGSDGSIDVSLGNAKTTENPKNIADQNTKTASFSNIGIKTANNLQQVTNTTSAPNNAIASLVVEFPDGDYLCTGFYVDNNTMITAGHCVYDTLSNTPANAIYYFRGQNGYHFPYDSGATSAFWVNAGWVNTTTPSRDTMYIKDAKHDFAAVRTDVVSNSWFDIRSTNHAVGEQVLAHGYPAEGSYDGNYQYKSLGKITSLTNWPNAIQHNGYVLGGMSGGPIWNTKVGWTAVISLNSCGSNADSANYGPRFTGSTYDRIVYWMSR